MKNLQSGGIPELANVSIVHPGDLGSNLGLDIIFSDSVDVGIKFKSVGL
jgi:hypothetical protein